MCGYSDCSPVTHSGEWHGREGTSRAGGAMNRIESNVSGTRANVTSGTESRPDEVHGTQVPLVAAGEKVTSSAWCPVAVDVPPHAAARPRPRHGHDEEIDLNVPEPRPVWVVVLAIVVVAVLGTLLVTGCSPRATEEGTETRRPPTR